MSDALQKDLILKPGEFAFLVDETKGNINCNVGPHKMSLSQSDKLVRFDEKTKTFVDCYSYEEAIQRFITIPESWYCVLKNPVKDNRHPLAGTSNTTPDEMQIGRKINLRGPLSFALYPGQMAKVVKGHSLRSNQYLLARVYEAEAANASHGKVLDTEGNTVEIKDKYVDGQILVIKGTEVSFYIPGDGIEIIPVNNDPNNGYIRSAETLERLEYCILKDENGSKRYAYGPAVVFPEPTETFVTSPKGGNIFKALELSPISGIYIKVIAEYTDDNNVIHPVGEEQFITGNEQMIYYPRPEHAIINYDNKFMHHAIAIPEGEGRYVLNRLTGEIRTVTGPAMYLPDPRTEVIVKRKLSARECQLWFPNNNEVLLYNDGLTEKFVEKTIAASATAMDAITAFAATTSTSAKSLANFEANANVARGTSYTKPRTIMLDTKFEGVVSLDIWNGYAVNVISKSGERRVVCGPQTILLDYDETLEELQLSTRTPKSEEKTLNTVFLRCSNNKVSDKIGLESSDGFRASVKLSYHINFDINNKDKWFNTINYVQRICDFGRNALRKTFKSFTIEEIAKNYDNIIRQALMETEFYKCFAEENGIIITDCDILDFTIQDDIADIIDEHQLEIVRKNFRLAAAEKELDIAEKMMDVEVAQADLKSQKLRNQMELQRFEAIKKTEIQAEINRQTEAEKLAAKQAEADLQVLINAVQEEALNRKRASDNAEIEYQTKLAAIEKARQATYAETVASIMASIGPDLAAALTANSNNETLRAIADAIAPYAISKGDESISDVVVKLTRGTPVEQLISGVNLNVDSE